ncbi:MAG TPA: outer membrane protein transport protein [Gallionella sp.]|nr:outer membrane protein transport protein [Gallionella sp.]
MKVKQIVGSVLSAVLLASPLAYATNGMLMEGYGPISTGMGGASMAIDNGTAGMANNPATLGMMQDGTSRLDISLGGLHPNVVSKMAGMPDAKSGGTAYYMPAVGWVKKDGALAYGVGMFSQGGMGTEYTAADWVSAGSGRPSRSEVGIGNVIIPLAYDVSPDFKIGGTLDVVWSGMDLQMAMATTQMFGLMTGGNLAATGGGAGAVAPFIGVNPATGAYTPNNNVAYFNFSDNSKFTGKAKSTSVAGKLGMTLRVSDSLTVGATYHSKTRLGDMTADGAQVTMIDNANALGGGAGANYTMTGKVTVVNFQFPEVFGIGAAYKVTDDVMLAIDYKRIGWSKVMKDFHMTFVSPDMGGINMDMKMPQNWVDQDVFNIGLAYKATDALTLRAGMNLANNPVPNSTVNPLFPAIVKNHYTVGAGYALNKVSELNGSVVYAPKVTVTAPAAAGGYTIDHSQTNWQMMYSHRF